jgi:hypothetical protein
MKTVTLSPSQMKTINKTTFDNDIIEIEENGIKY